MSWTQEKIDLLVELWEKKYSASEIADQIGAVSRNAVISKANRLGLKKKANENREKKPKTNIKPIGPLNLYDLGETMCKWPYGDPQEKNFHFCGELCFENLPYCSEHAVKAYHTITKKRMKESKKSSGKIRAA